MGKRSQQEAALEEGMGAEEAEFWYWLDLNNVSWLAFPCKRSSDPQGLDAWPGLYTAQKYFRLYIL